MTFENWYQPANQKLYNLNSYIFDDNGKKNANVLTLQYLSCIA